MLLETNKWNKFEKKKLQSQYIQIFVNFTGNSCIRVNTFKHESLFCFVWFLYSCKLNRNIRSTLLKSTVTQIRIFQKLIPASQKHIAYSAARTNYLTDFPNNFSLTDFFYRTHTQTLFSISSFTVSNWYQFSNSS